MMSEWKDLKTLQEVAAAQAAGEEILVKYPQEAELAWVGKTWSNQALYRSRPAKKTKTIVLREALVNFKDRGWFCVVGEKSSIEFIYSDQEIKWLDTPERIVEIEE